MFHYHCCRHALTKRWSGPMIAFRFRFCSLCEVHIPISHPMHNIATDRSSPSHTLCTILPQTGPPHLTPYAQYCHRLVLPISHPMHNIATDRSSPSHTLCTILPQTGPPHLTPYAQYCHRPVLPISHPMHNIATDWSSPSHTLCTILPQTGPPHLTPYAQYCHRPVLPISHPMHNIATDRSSPSHTLCTICMFQYNVWEHIQIQNIHISHPACTCICICSHTLYIPLSPYVQCYVHLSHATCMPTEHPHLPPCTERRAGASG